MAGFDIKALARFIKTTVAILEVSLDHATRHGHLVAIHHHHVRFTHDRPRTAAYNIIPLDKRAELHYAISLFLQEPDLVANYVFDATDHAITARELGLRVERAESFIEILLLGMTRAAHSASFSTAQRCLRVANSVVDESGGMSMWYENNQPLYLQMVSLHAETCSALKTYDESLDEVRGFC